MKIVAQVGCEIKNRVFILLDQRCLAAYVVIGVYETFLFIQNI